ncbi:MAG: ABC transporter ATP-binding protein/permease [Methanobacteriaceae archaeon]|jgi:ATP-binding cassette subfamily B protein/subfamily B ATP-binding cassette protein MsbA|nr:MAG: multidrug ABC transporter ATP-binding protein [Methanobacterium sp. BRmetb2]MCC7557429.1 ABC transporter ATP-binding protein/permease [Methanobacteriaceae archaeon]
MIKESFKFFFNKFIRKHVLTIIIVLALSFFTLVFSFISPLLIKSLVDNVFIARKDDLFFYIVMGILGMYIISSVSSYFNSYVSGKLQLTLLKEVAESSFSVVQYTSLKNNQSIKVGDLITRIMSNSQVAINIPVRIIPQFFMIIVSIIVPFLIMLSLNLQLGLIILSPVILFALTSSIFGKRMESIQKIFLESNASLYSFLKENFSIIPLIKIFRLEKWSQNKFKKEMDNYYSISLDYTKTVSLSSALNSLILGVPIVLLIISGGYRVMDGTISLGTFTAFIAYTSIFFSPISQLSSIWTSYKSSLPAFDRVKEIFDMESVDNGDREIEIKEGKIQFENVWFSYNGRHILKDFNATFTKGLNYIVGENGTGKSTLLKLICALYPVDKGVVTIDRQPIMEVKRESLNHNVALVFSDPYLFDSSIYENIRIGNLEADKDDIVRVAKQVKIHEFIESAPYKYDTNVGEDGLSLSSGEKQKIALARAILKDSPIILLDEVTKSIDADSRESINEVIYNLKEDKTIIMVTHNAHEIDVNGNIIYLNH